MDQALTVVVPVHNAQHIIMQQATELLEVLSDVTGQFQLLIVDDASTDQTEEICHELAREYPQVEVHRESARGGLERAVTEGIRRSRGNVVFVQDTPRISALQLRRLWETRFDRPVGDEDLVAATGGSAARVAMPDPQPLDASLVRRLVDWGSRLTVAEQGADTIAPPKLRRRSAKGASGPITADATSAPAPSPRNSSPQNSSSSEAKMKIRRAR